MKRAVFALFDALGVNALFRRLNRGRIKVLLYHNVTPRGDEFDFALTSAEFDRQLAYLKRHYNPVTLDQSGAWIGYRADRVNVLVTFDDGIRNNLTDALPIMRRHGFGGVFFLIADCVAQGSPPPFLIERAGPDGPGAAAFTVNGADARAMMAEGATIGSHSTAHRDHRTFDDGADLADARAARATLEAAVGAPVASFAFPWGHHRPGQAEAFAQVYARVFLTRHGFCGPDDAVIPRNEVADLAQLKAAASGALDFFRRGA